MPKDPKEISILITFATQEQRTQVKRAAKAAGMSVRGYCRHIVLTAAGVAQPVGQNLSGEAQDAVAALISLDMAEDTAQARVAAVMRKYPDLTAAQIINRCYQEKP